MTRNGWKRSRAKQASSSINWFPVREIVRKQKIAELPKEERELLEMSPEDRSPADAYKTFSMEGKVKPSFYEVAARADKAQRVEALRLAEVAATAENQAGIIDRYREIVNFEYWRRRCDMEQTPDALAARRSIHEANTAFKAADLTTAKTKYEEGLQAWRAVLDAYPQFKAENIFVDDLNEEIDRYRKLLEQLDLKFPEDFVLQDILKSNTQVAPQPDSQPKDVTGDPTQPGTPKKKSDLDADANQPQ